MRFRRAEIIPVLAAAALASCAHESSVSGRPPESVPREASHEPGPSRESLYRQRELTEGGPKVEKVEAGLAVIGVAAGRTFHRPGCGKLKGVTVAEQVQFTSSWQAYDAGYASCEECHSGN